MSALAACESRLRAMLAASAPLRTANPFTAASVEAWREEISEPVRQLLDTLSDDEADSLLATADEGRALRKRFAAVLPVLGEFDALERAAVIDEARGGSPAIASPHLRRDLPARKAAQIDAFLAASGALVAPGVDWCSGKGHLARFAALRDRIEVTCIERDAALCRSGEAIARRDRAGIRFVTADALDDATRPQLAGRHVLALHACGELHRHLVGAAAGPGQLQVKALDLAPCCHHRGDAAALLAAPDSRALGLGADDLRLSVTGRVTASAAEWRRHRRQLGWQCALRRLGQACWQRTGEQLPAQRDGLREVRTFADWVAAIADSQRLVRPSAVEVADFEGLGHREASAMLRASLPRLAFQRPIETWLVLRLALQLEAQGFVVRVKRFCDAALTPRNLLVSARLPA